MSFQGRSGGRGGRSRGRGGFSRGRGGRGGGGRFQDYGPPENVVGTYFTLQIQLPTYVSNFVGKFYEERPVDVSFHH